MRARFRIIAPLAMVVALTAACGESGSSGSGDGGSGGGNASGEACAPIEGDQLVVLEDDKGLQNAENLVPVVNAEGPAGTEEVADLLNSLSETLTTEDLAELIRRVDEDREQAADVAEDYLAEQGLIEA